MWSEMASEEVPYNLVLVRFPLPKRYFLLSLPT